MNLGPMDKSTRLCQWCKRRQEAAVFSKGRRRYPVCDVCWERYGRRPGKEPSDALNKRIAECMRLQADGADDVPNWRQLADQFGVSHDNVIQRASRIRRGLIEIEGPACDCDEHGPCVQHISTWKPAS